MEQKSSIRKKAQKMKKMKNSFGQIFSTDATTQLDAGVKKCIQSFNAGRVDLRSDEFYHVTLHSFIIRHITSNTSHNQRYLRHVPKSNELTSLALDVLQCNGFDCYNKVEVPAESRFGA